MKKLKSILLFISLFLYGVHSLYSQRTISGRVLGEDLDILYDSSIYINDTIEVGRTDFNGYFKVSIPDYSQEITFWGLGYENTTITISKECEYVEVILLLYPTYDFMTSHKIDRLRYKRFKKLPELYLRACEKGLFKLPQACFEQDFVPIKSRLDEIEKQMKEKSKKVKETFKKLAVGDTIAIPFSTSYHEDGTNRTTLIVWSSYTSQNKFDCIIDCIIISKNRARRGYNLICEITDVSNCKYDSIVYNKKVLKTGQLIKHNMRNYKILPN